MASIQFRNRNASKTKKVSRLTLILRYKANDEWNLLSILSKIEVPNILDKKYYPLEIKREVEDLKIHILSELKKRVAFGFKPSKEWLQSTHDEFYNIDGTEKGLFTYWIDMSVKEAEMRNLKPNTLKLYRGIKNLMTQYNEYLEIVDLTGLGMSDLAEYMYYRKGYKPSNIKRQLKQIQLICKLALSKGQPIGTGCLEYSYKYTNDYEVDKEVIFLTKEEIERIEALELTNNYLIRARKWLIIGCYTGQRDKDLLSIDYDSFFEKHGDLFIRITQQKTVEKTRIKNTILALPKVREIYYKDELPRKISSQRLNDYIKEICCLAKINDPINYYKTELVTNNLGEQVRRYVKKERSKWEYITIHTFRRTLCTMLFGKVPNRDVMKMSGHRTEREFLGYLGETDYSFDSIKGVENDL